MNKITAFLAVLALTAAATQSAVASQYRIGTSNSGGDVYVAVRAVAGSGDAAEANCRTAVDDLPGTPDTMAGCREKPADEFRRINGPNDCYNFEREEGFVCRYRTHEDGTTHRDENDCHNPPGYCGAQCAVHPDTISRDSRLKNCSHLRPELYFDGTPDCQEPLDYIGNRPNNVEDGLRCFENPAAAPRSGANLPQAEFNNQCMVAVKRNGANAPLVGGESLQGIGVGIENNCVDAYQAAITNCHNCDVNNPAGFSVIPLNDNGDLFLADGARECPPGGDTLDTDDFTCDCDSGGAKLDHRGICSLCIGRGEVRTALSALICICDTENKWSGTVGNCQLCPDDQVFNSDTETCEGCHESAEMGDSGACECADDHPKTSAEGEPTMCGDISCDNPNELLNSEGTKCVCMDEHNDYAEPGSCVADAVCEPNEVHINDNSDCVCADGFNDYANPGICEEDAKCEANQIFINDNSDCENCDGKEIRNANNECFCNLDNFDVLADGSCVEECPTEMPVRNEAEECEVQTLDCPAANQIPNFGQTECICAPGHNEFVTPGSCVADANCRANQIFINDNSDCRNCPGNTTRNSENACVCNLDNFDVFEGNCVDKCESPETRNETTGNCEIVDDNEEENPGDGVGGDTGNNNDGDTGNNNDGDTGNNGDGDTGNNGGVGGDNVVIFTVTVTVTVTVTALTEENVVDYGGQRYTVMAEAGADEAIAVINEQEGQETHLRVVARATPAPGGGGGGGSAAGIIGGIGVVALALWYFTSGDDDLAWTPSYSFANHNGNLSYSVGSRWTATANDWRLYWQTRKNGDRFVYGSGASYNGNILSAAMNSQSEGKQTDLDLALTINESFGLWNFGGGYHFDMQLSDEADEATETQNRLNARIRYTMDKWILSATANTDGNQTRGAVNYSYRF